MHNFHIVQRVPHIVGSLRTVQSCNSASSHFVLNECAVYFSCASNSVKCTIHCKAAEDDGDIGRSVLSQAKKKERGTPLLKQH